MTQETYKINHLNCGDSCLVYLATCRKCFKHYVGETADRFSGRTTPNFERRDGHQQRHLYEHFLEIGHIGFIGDISITLRDKKDPFKFIKREDQWRQTLKTPASHGLSKKESP